MGWGISGIFSSYHKMKTKRAENRTQRTRDQLEYQVEMARIKSDEKLALDQLRADMEREGHNANYANASYDLLSMELGANAKKSG